MRLVVSPSGLAGRYIAAFGVVRARVFWRAASRRERLVLCDAIEQQLDTARAHLRFSSWDRDQARALSGEFAKLLEQCGRISPQTRLGPHIKQFAKARRELSSISQRLTKLESQTERWRAESDGLTMRGEAVGLRSAKIPGRQFEPEAARLKREFLKVELKASQAKSVDDVRKCLKERQEALNKWDKAILVAEDTRSGVGKLELDLNHFDRLDLAYDPVTMQTFDATKSDLPRIQDFIRDGNYPAAHNLLEHGRRRCRELSELIERRHAWARKEIDLWLGHPSVASEFPELSSFSVRLTPDEISQWRNVVVPRIELFVNAHASATRASYASSLRKQDRRLSLSWSDVQSEESLAEFVDGVVEVRARLLS